MLVHINRLKRAFGKYDVERPVGGSHLSQSPNNLPRSEAESWERTHHPDDAWAIPVIWHPLPDSDEETDMRPA